MCLSHSPQYDDTDYRLNKTIISICNSMQEIRHIYYISVLLHLGYTSTVKQQEREKRQQEREKRGDTSNIFTIKVTHEIHFWNNPHFWGYPLLKPDIEKDTDMTQFTYVANIKIDRYVHAKYIISFTNFKLLLDKFFLKKNLQ